MAKGRKWYGRRRYKKPMSAEQRKHRELTKLAYNYGLISQGLKNSESAIHESYVKGQERAKNGNVAKKPLY